MSALKNIAGHVFGRLTVLYRTENDVRGKARWQCTCECGNSPIVNSKHLLEGNTVSCGCYAREASTVRNATHGHSRGGRETKIYTVWHTMRQRCENQNAAGWSNYGGRGITVCERWNSFENFYADMGEPPTAKHSLDRVNNDGNYEKSNCRWATPNEQQRNRRNNFTLAFNGTTACLSEWAEITGLHRDTIQRRITRCGWTLEKALTAPCRKIRRRGVG